MGTNGGKGMVFEVTELHSSWSTSPYQVLCDIEEMLHLSEVSTATFVQLGYYHLLHRVVIKIAQDNKENG